MLAIYKKEMQSFFINPIGYVFVAIFLIISSLVSSLTTILSQSSDTTGYFQVMLFFLIVLIPLLTMKLFSEEKKLRTEQLLLTAPVSITATVIAKYLSAVSMYLIVMVLSLLNFIPLYVHAEPTTAIILGNFIGITLVGLAFISIGVFVSALTENQLVAAVTTIGIILGLMVIGFLNSLIEVYFIRVILSWISVFNRFSNFTYGVFDFSALLYYLSISAVFLFLTIRIYEKRRWS